MKRRTFIQLASLATAGNLSGLHPFGMMNALAQTSNDYKALVCIFLFGGNDSNNMIVPYDKAGYANYQSIRGAVALPYGSLLGLSRLPQYALHPSLPEVQAIMNAGAAGFVANVGTLDAPLTRTQYMDGANAPSMLFSHPDQQQQWQGSAGSAAGTGWGGRISDAISPQVSAGRIPMITSVAGDTLFCDGRNTTNFSVDPGVIGAGVCSAGDYCDARLAAAQQLLAQSSNVSLVNADNTIGQLAYEYELALQSALGTVNPVTTTFPSGNSLAAQLQQVAQIISARQPLGVTRQIFFCGLGNFDTHNKQLVDHAPLLRQLSQAIGSFYQATQELGVSSQVTTFTMSEFSRALQPNSSLGTDHAWGSHQLVVGGAFQGGPLFGTMPVMELNGPSDADTNGRWIPSIASIQYGATLASWFGVPASSLSSVFPNISNFSTQTLSFLS